MAPTPSTHSHITPSTIPSNTYHQTALHQTTVKRRHVEEAKKATDGEMLSTCLIAHLAHSNLNNLGRCNCISTEAPNNNGHCSSSVERITSYHSTIRTIRPVSTLSQRSDRTSQEQEERGTNGLQGGSLLHSSRGQVPTGDLVAISCNYKQQCTGRCRCKKNRVQCPVHSQSEEHSQALL